MKIVPVVALVLAVFAAGAPVPGPTPSAPLPSSFDFATKSAVGFANETQTMITGGIDVLLPGIDYSNLLLIDGVTPNENIRGQGFPLFVEDAIQETTTAASGVSVRARVEPHPGEAGDRKAGTLSGTVFDTQGNPLPGAQVTLLGSGPPAGGFTNDNGEFRLNGLLRGRSTLIVELDGLSTVKYPDLMIQAGTNTTVDVTLSPVEVEEVIPVTGGGPLSDELEIGTGVTITRMEIEQLPVTRDPSDAILLSPGLSSGRNPVGANESGQQEVFPAPGVSDDSFAVDAVIITDLSTFLGGSPRYGYGSLVNQMEDLFEEVLEDRQAATGGPDSLPSGGVTISAITGSGANDARTSVSLPRGFWVGDPEDWDLTPADRNLLIHLGLRPEGISCFEGYELPSGLEGSRRDPMALETGKYLGVLTPPIHLTLEGYGGSKVFERPGPGPGIRIVEFSNCGEGQSFWAVDFPERFDPLIEDSTAASGVSGVEGDSVEAGDRQTGTLSGTVVDKYGKPLPGVLVTAFGIGPAAVQVTNALGEFRFYNVPPGELGLLAEQEGFSTVEYPRLSIRTGMNTTVEVTLSPAVEEVITVTSESPLLDERKIATGTRVTQIELAKIPTARDPWDVIRQSPDVNGDRDGAENFVVDFIILGHVLGGLPTRDDPDPDDPDPFEEGEPDATGGTDVLPPTGGLTLALNTRRGTNNPRGSARYLRGDGLLGQVEIDIGQAPDGTSCIDGVAVKDTDGNPLPDAGRLGPEEWVGVDTDPSPLVTLDGGQGTLGDGTWGAKLPSCDDNAWPDLWLFDFSRWYRFLTTEAGPAALAAAAGETGDAPGGEQVTIRLEDRTAGVDVILFDPRDEPRHLGTTGEGGVTRVPAGEVEDGTALIAYAVACGDDEQIVFVRPEYEEAFLDAYGDCAEPRLERFAWYPGDVLVDILRGLARWIPYSQALQPLAELDPVTSPEALGGPSGRGGGASDMEVVIRGTGGSTGEVVEAYLVNHGYEPVRIRADGLVLEPVTEEDLDPAARTRMQEILDAASSGKPVSAPRSGASGSSPVGGAGTPGIGTGWGHGGEAPADFGGWGALLPEARQAEVVRVVLDAYCLEFAKDVPVEGVLFRIVDREAQQEAVRFREIVRASRRLQENGALHPDGDPESYFHSTRQWATWADELGLDRDGFEEAFVEHARKNFDAAGRPWTAEVEAQVRGLVPNRWADVTTVLEEADNALRERGGADAGEMPAERDPAERDPAEGDPAEREPARLDPARPAAGLGDGVADPRRSR